LDAFGVWITLSTEGLSGEYLQPWLASLHTVLISAEKVNGNDGILAELSMRREDTTDMVRYTVYVLLIELYLLKTCTLPARHVKKEGAPGR
jgi:hypothetical protein